MSAAPPAHVVVIGAGLGGLAAAHALARPRDDRPIDVTLLEAGPEEDARGGALLRAVPSIAPTLHGLALELGIAERVHALPLELDSARAVHWQLRPRPPLALEPALEWLGAPLEALRARRLRRLLRWYGAWLDPREPERGVRLDDRSAADFCRLYLGAGPRSARLLGALELGFGCDPAELSRLALLLLLDPWGELCARVPLGLGELHDALLRRLKDVRFGARVRGVRADARELWLDSGERIRADAIVVASGPEHASRVVEGLLPGERLALAGMGSLDGLALRVRVRVERTAPGACVPALLARGAGPLAGIADVSALEPGAALEPDPARPAARSWLLRARAGFAARAAERPATEVSAALLAAGEQLCPGLLECAEGHELERAPAAVPLLRVGCFRAGERLLREAERRADRPLFFAAAAGPGAHPEAELAAGLRAADQCALRMRAARS